jgi:hypothetical protein
MSRGAQNTDEMVPEMQPDVKEIMKVWLYESLGGAAGRGREAVRDGRLAEEGEEEDEEAAEEVAEEVADGSDDAVVVGLEDAEGASVVVRTSSPLGMECVERRVNETMLGERGLLP